MSSSVRLTSTEDVLAALPALIGFTPTQSLLLLDIRRDENPGRIGPVMRVDLPDSSSASVELATQLAVLLRNSEVRTVVVVIVDSAGTPHDLSRRELLTCLTDALGECGIEIKHALWAPRLASGEPYACYLDGEHRGAQSDPRASMVAATLVEQGYPVCDSRDGLVQELAPNGEVDQQRRTQLVESAVIRTVTDTAAHRPWRYQLLQDALAAAADGVLPGTESEVVELLVALSDPVVRDTGIGDSPAAAQRLCTFLTREAPTSVRAEPAALVAVAAYRNGDGARAQIALDTALQCCPEHTLALLLTAVLEQGVPPWRCEPVLRHARDEATRICHLDDAAPPAHRPGE